MVNSSAVGSTAVNAGTNRDIPGAELGLPTLVTQVLIERGEKTADGTLIMAVAPAWHAILWVITQNPESIYQIPPDKWEEIIAGAYEQDGFDVVLTPRSGDGGRDVIAEKRGWGSVRFIDQVKAYKPGHLVTADEVRSLVGVLHADQRASKGLVTTTSDFAPRILSDPSISPFLPTRLELVNGKALVERLSNLAAG